MRFTRVTLFFIAFIIGLGFYMLADHFIASVKPQTLQATEEMMIDCAHLLAEVVEENNPNNNRIEILRKSFDDAHNRKFESQIFEYIKQEVGINAYMTDADGMVLFDSDEGKREGLDYKRKRDVHLTLSGEYGARSSNSVLYVSAPIGDPADPSGVLTVYKPQQDMKLIIDERRRIIIIACILIGSGIIFLIGAVFLWLFHPIGKITKYAQAIERGERPQKPKIGIGREVNTLAHALDTMRDTLEDRKYVERYIQTLTHEMKSPLAAIQGAAELLDEEMPAEDRKRFIENIRSETARSERLINRLLELAAIESRKQLDETQSIDFSEIVSRAADQAKPMAEIAKVTIDLSLPDSPTIVHGDAFILRAAITNLLENAIDFSPENESVRVSLSHTGNQANLTIQDNGEGIPDYAQEKVFERFYSLRHPNSGRKGTGLGLTLVREAAELHHGTITLSSPNDGGTLATWTQPLT